MSDHKQYHDTSKGQHASRDAHKEKASKERENFKQGSLPSYQTQAGRS